MAVRPTDTPLPQRYRTIRRLGSGGMATVFLAEDSRLGRRVAVKRLHADSPEGVARRFDREAKVGASLNHPNVVTVYDTAIDDEGVLIVMEYVDGETLSQALAGDRVDTARAVEVIAAVGAALDHAHSNGVIHRDVKPGNVLLGAGGAVKLVDLGIATAAEATRLTAPGMALGTPSYMAPEQLAGGQVGPPADVYALAAVAFEALSGRKARTGSTPIEIAHRVATEPPPDLREAWPAAPPGAAEALRRGMAREPDDRPATAGELAGAVSSSLDPAAEPARTDSTIAMPVAPPPRPPTRAPTPPPPPAPAATSPAPPARPQPAPRRGHAGAWALTAVAAMAIVAAVIVLTSGDGREVGRSGGQATESGGADAPASDGSGGGEAPADPPPDEPATEGVPASSGEDDPALGARLNDQGKGLIDDGRPEEAVPVLERSVAAFPDGTEDVNYAYALFNLGNALRLSGQPEAAIPVLERRLEIPNQPEAVRRELELARRDAE